jgi:hypothetical protein
MSCTSNYERLKFPIPLVYCFAHVESTECHFQKFSFLLRFSFELNEQIVLPTLLRPTKARKLSFPECRLVVTPLPQRTVGLVR